MVRQDSRLDQKRINISEDRDLTVLAEEEDN